MPRAILILSIISLTFSCNPAFAATYSTNFQNAENPVSEGGRSLEERRTGRR